MPDDYRASESWWAPTPPRWRRRCGRCWVHGVWTCSPGTASARDWVTDIDEAAARARRARARGRLRCLARPLPGGLRSRRGLHLERHHVWRSRARCRPGSRRNAQGLTICDATSSVFAMPPRLEQARRGDLVLAEGAGRRGRRTACWRCLPARWSASRATRRPGHCPKIFRLTKQGASSPRASSSGDTINTPSLLCVEDCLDALGWVEGIGGRRWLRGPLRGEPGRHLGLGRAHAVDRLPGG